MAGLPVVIVDSGGLPVTISETDLGSFPMEVAVNGFGIAVTIVASGGLPVTGIGSGPIIVLSSQTIAEDASLNDVIGTISLGGIVEDNWLDPITYTITADPDAKFDIDGDDLIVDDTLDFEDAESHSVTIQADNGTDDPITRTFAIIITNVIDDTNPDAFNLGGPVTDADLGGIYTTDEIEFAGMDGPGTLVMTGTMTDQQYRINGGTWTNYTVPFSVEVGEIAEFRGMASELEGTSATIIVTVGTTTDTFTVTTAEGIAELDTPTLDLQAASDDGASDTDNETTITTPSFDAVFPSGLLEDDHILVENNSVEVDDHTVTAGEAGGSTISLGLAALSVGEHSIRLKHTRGADESNWSTPLVVTIVSSGSGGSPIGLLLTLTYASGGSSTAGVPVGMLLVLTKAA